MTELSLETPGVAEACAIARQLSLHLEKHGIEAGVFHGMAKVSPLAEKSAATEGRAFRAFTSEEDRVAYVLSIGHAPTCALTQAAPQPCDCGVGA